MRLRPGDLIGPYEIIALIGVGGMGEVYRARDTRLRRDVALKTLSASIAGSHVRRARFEREVLSISQLNHPNICAVYDVGGLDDLAYFVMEYIDGEPLAERLRRGPLEWRVALNWAMQIAGALDAAHHRGITHRDLKPANVMVTGDVVKLLDFGLAKLDTPEDTTAADDTTLSLTAELSVLGTPHYMSPEQLEGRAIDPRTDLFALGAVLYEMLTARKAFAGASRAAVAAAILTSQPQPVSAIVQSAPTGLDRIVQRALAKQPDERWQTARDLINELQWILRDPSGLGFARLTPRRRRTLAVLGAGAALAIAAAVAGPRLELSRRANATTVRLSFMRPAGLELTNTGRPVLTIAPDGRTIVFNANNQLYVRRLDAADAMPLSGTQGTGVTTPFFSPDGRWIGFFAADTRELKKIPVGGGAAVTICGPPPGSEVRDFGASWTPGGDVLFATHEGVFRVPAAGGTPARIISPEDGEMIYGPQQLPDGEHVLLTVTRASGADRWERAQIVAQSLSSGQRTVIVERGADARYVSSGHLVYAVGTTVFAVPFDARTLRPLAAPTVVLSGVRRAVIPATNTAAAFFSVSDTGVLAYVPSDEDPFVNVSIDLVGRSTPLTPQGLRGVHVSPDGSQIVGSHDGALWVHAVSGREAPRRLASVDTANANAVWTPDGTHVAFREQTASSSVIAWRAADGTGEQRTLLATDGVPVGWSADGRTLYYLTQNQLWAWSEPSEPRFLSALDAPYASLSPDRRWVAFHTREHGTMIPYIQSLDDPPIRYQIAPTGHAPLWSPDGRKLFYVAGETNSLMSIDVRTAPSVNFGTPIVLVSQIMHGWALAERWYDIAPDGARLFAQVPDLEALRPRQIDVVLNWLEELERLAPAP